MEHKAFDDINHAVAHNTLLAYQDLNKRLNKNTDARNYQLGAVIRLDNKPIALFNHKLTKTQMWYMTTEN